MTIRIGSNTLSLNAQRRLAQNTSTLSSIYERLSSGQRINKASDDAAGLAIAESLSADTRVYSQAIRNISDGLSALTIADGAIDALSNIVIRIQELAEQAANGSYSNQQRRAMDDEAQALSKEFLRISKSTKFNGQGLFDGTLTDGLRLQCGYGIDGSIQSTLGQGLGTGSFGEKITYATEVDYDHDSHSNAVALGDVNGDGILDLVTAGQVNGQGQATVLLGKGDGTFGDKRTYATDGSSSSALSLGDVNGDGILDLVTAGFANGQGGQATVLLGKGDGTFGDKRTYATGSYWNYALSLGDLNGDGVLDLVIGSAGEQGTVFLGTGDGTFGDKLTYVTETIVTRALTLGDVNGDGILDLVAACYAEGDGGQATILIGKGDGTFGDKRAYATEGDESFAVTLGDINGDGVLDLVTAGNGGSSGQATVLFGRGDGTFGDKRSYTTEGYSSYAVTLADVNGDGILDLVTAGEADNQGQATVLLGKGDGTFGDKRTYATETAHEGSNYSSAVALGDVNGDGVLDLVTAGKSVDEHYGEYSQGQASVLLGTVREGLAPILPFSLGTMADARQAIGMLARKLDSLSAQRGTIGAFQSRLAAAASTLDVARENYTSAGSRIRDADVAQESADLVRTQILQQASAAVLAQANQAPALAIRLLR